jgi:hypothetical protein
MAVALAVTVPAQAQSTRRERRESNQNRRNRIRRTIDETYGHRWETGGGGGYLRFRPGGNLQQNSEISFWTTTTFELNPKLGVVGDIRGAFGNAKLGNNGLINYNPQISEYSFMAGPSYRFVRKEKFAVTAFATGGAAIGKFDGGSKGFTSSDFQAVGYDLWNSGTAAAFSAGLNLDYNFFPNLAARVTPTYLGTTFGSKIENNKGLNIGLVYRFGKIK